MNLQTLTTATLALAAAGLSAATEIVVNGDTDISSTDANTVLTVNSGTATLLPRSQRGYRHYRFKVERPYGASANYVAFSEIRLYNGATDVTSARSGYTIAYSSEWDDSGSHFLWGKKFGDSSSSEYLHGYSKVLDGDLTTDVAAADGKPSASAETRDKVWIRIDFANPQLVTSYDWARSDYYYKFSDTKLPDPADWRFQGSDDGTAWTDLDVHTGFLMPAPANSRAAWAGPFACSYTNGVCEVGAINMAEGTEVALSTDELHVGAISGGTLTLSSGAALSLDDGATVSQTTIPSGTIVKTGTGSAEIEGDTSFAGALAVAGGTLRFSGTGGNEDEFYRFTFTQTYGQQQIRLGRIVFYDANGERTGYGSYTEVTDIAAKDLTAGQIGYSSSYVFNDYETPNRLFLENLTSDRKCMLKTIGGTTANLTGGNGLSFQFVVRMRQGTTPIASYLFESANYSASSANRWCSPVKWTVESSPDGETWRTVDSVTAGTPENADWTLWNGGVPWEFSNRNAPAGTAFLPAATVSVADGARLDLCGSQTTQIGNLAIDVTAGAGTIDIFNPAASGNLYLSNLGSWSNESPLPITLESVLNPEALAGWSVYIDGARKSRRVTLRNGSLYFANEATVLSVR